MKTSTIKTTVVLLAFTLSDLVSNGQWQLNSPNLYTLTNVVGIGISTPQQKLHIYDGSLQVDGMLPGSPQAWGTGWRPALITPLAYAWRTNQLSSLNLYYGYGMTDRGWYWATSPVSNSSSNVTYPMSLILSATTQPRLFLSGRMTLDYGVIQKGGTFDINNTSDLGLYSLDPAAGIRLVSNRQPIRLYTDANAAPVGIGSTATLCIEPSGFVGIYTTTPGERLQVDKGNVLIKGPTNFSGPGSEAALFLGDNNHYIKTKWDVGISFGSYQVPEAMIIHQSTGKVGIGVSATSNWAGNYLLYVKNGIRTEKVLVDVASQQGWADYVFDEDYDLMTLADLEHYVTVHKHLPEIPTAEDVVCDGVELTDMQVKLLKKVEELTLYVVELNKKIETLEKKNQ